MSALVAAAEVSASPLPSLEEVKKRPTVIIVVGMAGSGKTTFLTRLHREISSGIICRSDENKVGKGYYINLDPACTAIPYPPQIDIRDTVDYKNVMSEYNLGPNGAIVTSLNLFATKFDVVMGILEKRVAEERDIDYIIVDTPGQIESFTWSASGQIVTESLASSFPTILSFVVDTPRCLSPSTFMSNMLYSCSMMYRSRLPMVVAFNKTDVVSSDTVESWMSDYDKFQEAMDAQESSGGSYYDSLNRSMALTLDEFYSTLNRCGVSAATGDGVDDFFSFCEKSREEYFQEYWKDLNDRRNAVKELKAKGMKKNMDKFDADLKDVDKMKKTEEPATFVDGFHSKDTISLMPYRQATDGRVLSVVGLGCSSFSDIFGEDVGKQEEKWKDLIIKTVKAGVNVLDTAPWYGDSERILGEAIKMMPRNAFYIHTKVGRYPAGSDKMFDFSKDKTLASVENSLKTLNVSYLDLVQIHDPEFIPDVTVIIEETLPALDELRKVGKLRRIGITGYPLDVQREIIERSTVKIDVSLSYGHLNLHDATLLSSTFSNLCNEKGITLLAAAPLSMGLLTPGDPPSWHPAPPALKERCKKANNICENDKVSLPHIATIYALAIEEVPCTLLGIKDDFELQRMLKAARSLRGIQFRFNGSLDELPLTETEVNVLRELLDNGDIFGGGVREVQGWKEV